MYNTREVREAHRLDDKYEEHNPEEKNKEVKL